MSEFLEKTFGGINIYYTLNLDGGGSRFGQEYVPVIQRRYPGKKFRRCFEWCAGPGFIGYSLLGHGLCESLCLADIHPPAVAAARYTAEKNQLGDRVTIYESDGLSALPAEEIFDLVVGNPPFYHHPIYRLRAADSRLYVDQNWRAHKDFFAGIQNHLEPRGIILLQECQWASDIQNFQDLITAGGLRLYDHFVSYNDPSLYYIEIRLPRPPIVFESF